MRRPALRTLFAGFVASSSLLFALPIWDRRDMPTRAETDTDRLAKVS